jgi:hypothetical protein
MGIQEIIGWTGALLFIVAYFLLSIRKLRADRLPYQLLNILGGICLVINSFHMHDYPSVFTNLVWAGIGVFAIYFNKIVNMSASARSAKED